MKTRFAFAVVVVALALTPVVLSIGALVLLPLAIVLLPLLLLAVVAAVPALLLWAVRGSEPHAVSGSDEKHAAQGRMPATAG